MILQRNILYILSSGEKTMNNVSFLSSQKAINVDAKDPIRLETSAISQTIFLRIKSDVDDSTLNFDLISFNGQV